jgi:hypothetical protein
MLTAEQAKIGAFRGLGDWQKELDILEGRAVSIGGKVGGK